MNKSWILTISTIIASFVVQFLSAPLESMGFTVTEAQLQSTFILPILTGLFGTINGIHKRETKAKIINAPLNSQQPTINPLTTSPKQTVTFTEKPKLGPVGAKYQTNFRAGKLGNELPYGTDLWIKRTDVRSYMHAQLFDSNMSMIQNGQSTEHDEDGDIQTTRLEMYLPNHERMPRGKYFVRSRGDAGSSDSTGTGLDEFYIV